jgi:hypothetical protein
MNDPGVQYVAHHWILLAGPAFLPAVVVTAVVLYVAMRDRRQVDRGDRSQTDADAGQEHR